MKKLFLSILLVLSLLCLSACSTDNELIGYWLSTDGGVINFIDSDTVTVGQYGQDITELEKYNYKVHGSVVELTLVDSPKDNPFTITYDFVIKDGVLTLSNNGESYSYHGEEFMQEEILVGLITNNP